MDVWAFVSVMTATRWGVFCSLVVAQGGLSLLMRVAGTQGSSVPAIVVIIELVKLVIALTLFTVEVRERDGRLSFSRVAEGVTSEGQRSLLLPLLGLAVMYAVNNQLSFFLAALMEPGVIFLFKALTSLFSAVLRIMVVRGAQYSMHQWLAILLQLLGVLIVQAGQQSQLPGNDTSKGTTLFSASLMTFSVLLTAAAGVWNETVVKGSPAPLQVQNAYLYVFGIAINFAVGLVSAGGLSLPHLSALDWAVVLWYASVGLLISQCYRYADALLKALAGNCTTITLLVIGAALHWSHMSISAYLGAAVVMASLLSYVVAEAPKPPAPVGV